MRDGLNPETEAVTGGAEAGKVVAVTEHCVFSGKDRVGIGVLPLIDRKSSVFSLQSSEGLRFMGWHHAEGAEGRRAQEDYRRFLFRERISFCGASS